MRRFFAILVLICATAIGAHAQSIRLGEQVPALSVTPDINETLELYNRDYTCLIFAHSDSKPCVDAMHNFAATAPSIERDCAIVVVTCEAESDRDIITERLKAREYILVFDDNNSTFKAFGIHYVPFVVIYRNKNSRIEWFGPIHQLDKDTIRQFRNR